MIIKLNPTGTHVHKRQLKVRIDIYPDPTDKTYPLHYVDHDGVMELNPCLCHFLTVDPGITIPELTAMVQSLFDHDTIRGIDETLSVDDSQAIHRLMRSKKGNGKLLAENIDASKVVSAINKKLDNLDLVVG